MKKLLTFLRKQGLALAILGGSIYGVMWVVENWRPAGSMTVVEAQAMDMKTMKAPIGVFPIGAGYALERNIAGSEKFPATVVALSDEDVIARIPGLVSEVHVYPGDRVSKGQLLATLEADEFDSKALAAMLAAEAKQSQVDSARSNLQREQASLSKSEVDVKAYEAAVDVAKSELLVAKSHVSHYQGEVLEIAAKRKEVNAELDYASIDYKREKELFDGGAISRDDLDKAKKRIETAQAKIEQVDAQRIQMDHELNARNAKQDAASNMVKQANARLEGAKESVNVSRAFVRSAQSNVVAKQRESSAARAAASGSSTLSSYTELRANDAGVVTDRLVSPGTPVMPGQTVLRLKVDREVRVQAEIPQRLANNVKVGTAVRISFGEMVHDAEVTSVSPFIQGRTRTFRVEAIVANSEGNWQVGAYAEMEVFTSDQRRSLSINNKSVNTASDGSNYVWLVVGEEGEIDKDAIYTCTMHPEVEHVGPGDCPKCKMALVPQDSTGNIKVEKRAVTIGVSDSLYTVILKGLVAGDQITNAGDDELFPGASVQVVEWDENGPLELPKGAGTMQGMDMGDDDMDDMDMDDNQTTSVKGHEDHEHGADDLFYCPMHPGVHSQEEGSCPICKMDLIPIDDNGDSEADDNKATPLKGHEDHEHGADDLFYCPMDPEVHDGEAGSCPICKMDLIPLPGGGN